MVVFDNHMHLDPKGRFLEALKEFKRAGGTHVALVSKPYEVGNYEKQFEEHLKVVKRAEELVKVLPVFGVHPAEISILSEHYGVQRAEEIMKRGLELAGKMVEEGKGVAIKSGRPHYQVSEELREASNRIMRFAMEVARDCDCAVQLHTESATEKTFEEIERMRREVGLREWRVVKHYSPPIPNEGDFIARSILASRRNLGHAVKMRNFLLETDYIDDPERPGAVLSPKSVPRFTKKLLELGYEDIAETIHREFPEKVYGVEMRDD
ncbi:MAG: TatD-related deoxyribonuclease [Archaeoglobi archaeon]|nr:TatD-related deoxyribonuclease [Archaeoglobi archaeon]